MRIAWGLIVVAADLFQFGGLLSVRADTCESPGISCTAGTGPIVPTPTFTCTVGAAGACDNTECCVTNELCSASAWATPAACTPTAFFGPALGTYECNGLCTVQECCIWHEWCYNYTPTGGGGVCSTGVGFKFDPTVGPCVGACEDTTTECCPAATCGNSYDYSAFNACAADEGPALPSVLCSTNSDVCDQSICCVTNESCSNVADSDCGNALWHNPANTCDGTCKDDGTDFSCCDKQACVTHFNSNDCSTGSRQDSVVCVGPCDEDECCA